MKTNTDIIVHFAKQNKHLCTHAKQPTGLAVRHVKCMRATSVNASHSSQPMEATSSSIHTECGRRRHRYLYFLVKYFMSHTFKVKVRNTLPFSKSVIHLNCRRADTAKNDTNSSRHCHCFHDLLVETENGCKNNPRGADVRERPGCSPVRPPCCSPS